MLIMQQARILRHRDSVNWRRSAQSAAAQSVSGDVRAQALTDWLLHAESQASELGPLMARHLIERVRDSLDRRRSRELGVDVLRGHALRVLLQSGTHDAISIARTASGDAHEVVTWCLADGADDDAVKALEMGRGLTMLAAGASGSVSERLEGIGEPELAREWRQSHDDGDPATTSAGTAVPSDVRHRVLDRLAASGDLTALLRSADRSGVATTLRELGYDALVYLIPQGRSQADPDTGRPLRGNGDVGRPGGALMVTAGGQLRWQNLPELTIRPDGVISVYLKAHRALLTGGGQPEDRDAWRRSLEDTCQWAWRAAMHPLQPMLAHLHENRRGTWQSEDVIFASYQNAGVRAFDIVDAHNPREVARLVPPPPRQIRDPRTPNGALVAQTSDLLVADDGLIVAGDLNGGLSIMQFEGAA